jgi:hypothetical protein
VIFLAPIRIKAMHIKISFSYLIGGNYLEDIEIYCRVILKLPLQRNI